MVLAGCGGKSEDESAREQKKVDAARVQLRDTRTQIQQARGELLREKGRLRTETATARAQLRRIQAQVEGANREVAKGTVPGDGTFVVGQDIQPGVYRAAAQPGFYWARLSSLNTSDIIDNGNPDGPVVIEVSSSDKALELANCSEFHRAG